LQPIYINSTAAITPIDILEEQVMLQPAIKGIRERFACNEPDYTTLIPAMQLRRMSRLLKMGIYTGMACLNKAKIEKPDGIITGTGKGSMTDTEKFVKELNRYKEEALNPTPFILSTYNAVNGAIALQTQATGYNQTFVHRGSSLELSLYDTQLRLNNAVSTQHYLTGCFDEMTEEYFIIKNKIGYWKQTWNNEIPLHKQCATTGSVPGEGAAFFLLSNRPAYQGAPAIQHIHTFQKAEVNELTGILERQLQYRNLGKEDIGLLVLGMNGDKEDQPYYDEVIRYIGAGKPVLVFKNLCGEYETASGFGLWLTLQAIQDKYLPGQAWLDKRAIKPRGNILFYNHYRRHNHNLLLLSS